MRAGTLVSKLKITLFSSKCVLRRKRKQHAPCSTPIKSTLLERQIKVRFSRVSSYDLLIIVPSFLSFFFVSLLLCLLYPPLLFRLNISYGAGTILTASTTHTIKATYTRGVQRSSSRGGHRNGERGGGGEGGAGVAAPGCLSPSWTNAARPSSNCRGHHTTTDRTRSPPSALRMSVGERRGDGGDVDGEKNGMSGGVSRWVEAGKKWLVGAALASSMLGGGALLSPGGGALPAFAASADETKQIGLCLLSECRGELASCLLNPK